MVMNKSNIILSEGQPWKCILRFSLPLLLGSLLQQLYYTIDTMMIGLFVNEEALSGVGTCTVLINLLVIFSVGFSAGAGIISAQYFGAKKIKEITQNAYATIVFLFIFGMIIKNLI